MESARKQPSISVLWKLASALQLSPAEFAGRIDKRLATLTRIGSGTSKGKALSAD